MSDYAFVSGLIFVFLVFLGVLLSIASYNANIQCPYTVADLTNDNTSNPITWFMGSIGLFFSPCSGLPWWIYLVIGVWAIAIFRWLTPLIWH